MASCLALPGSDWVVTGEGFSYDEEWKMGLLLAAVSGVTSDEGVGKNDALDCGFDVGCSPGI